MRLYRVESDKTFVEYQPEAFADNHKEAILESWLEGNPDAIVEDGRLLLIGRQVVTNLGKSIDLLALDRSGDVVVIELKRDETPRTTLAQALEYSAFASELDHEALSHLYRQYVREPEAHLSEDHRAHFELGDEEAVSFNKEQRIVIVGAAISPQVRETSAYLRRKGLRVTCVEFSYFTTEAGEELMSTEIVVGLEPVATKPSSSASSNWMTEERFLGLVGDCGPLFRALLKMAREHDFSINWGTKGFSMGTAVDGKRIVFLYGYPPDSMVKDYCSLYTEFGMLKRKVSEGADLAAETKASLTATGRWQAAGNELKAIMNKPFAETQIAELEAQMLKLTEEIHAHGLVIAAIDEEDGG